MSHIDTKKSIKKNKSSHATISHAKHKYCKTRENSNFLKNGQTVILVKTRNFSRSRLMKRTSPLESSREI